MTKRVYGNDMPAEVEWGGCFRILEQNKEGEKEDAETKGKIAATVERFSEQMLRGK